MHQTKTSVESLFKKIPLLSRIRSVWLQLSSFHWKKTVLGSMFGWSRMLRGNHVFL